MNGIGSGRIMQLSAQGKGEVLILYFRARWRIQGHKAYLWAKMVDTDGEQ